MHDADDGKTTKFEVTFAGPAGGVAHKFEAKSADTKGWFVVAESAGRVWLYRGGDALFVMDYADNPPGAPAGSKLVRGFLDLQVGPESVVAVGQNDVGLMQTLRIIIADVEQRHAIGECIAPENLIHRQLADEVGVGTMFVMVPRMGRTSRCQDMFGHRPRSDS